jgi:hypothetical protein
MLPALRPNLVFFVFLAGLGCGGSTSAVDRPLVIHSAEPVVRSSKSALLVAGDVDAPPAAPAIAADETPRKGRMAWYRFEETNGPVLDSSGHGHHGSASGSGVSRGQPGRIGRAIAFSGGHVQVPASRDLDFRDAATIELWVRIDHGGPMDVGSTVSRGTGNNDDNVLMNTSCGNMQTIFSHNGKTTNVTSECGAIPGGRWTHIAVVNDGKQLSVFVNGALARVEAGGVMGPIAADLFMGIRSSGIFPLHGALDEVQWWNITRSAPEVCADAGGTWTGRACSLDR